jgi:hypothetical protein
LRNRDEIVPIETLQAHCFLSLSRSGAWRFAKCIRYAENVAASDEGPFIRFTRNELDDFHNAPIHAVNLFGEIAGAVDQLAFS